MMRSVEEVTGEPRSEHFTDERVNSRWVSPQQSGGSSVSTSGSKTSSPSQLSHKTSVSYNENGSNILWVAVARDGVILSEVNSTDNTKVTKASRRLLKKEAKTGWDFYTYAIESQKRLVQAVKFHVYEKIPLKAGARAKLRGLENETFLNGASVRILDYLPDQDKYLIRPTVPLAEKLSTTGQLLVGSQFIVGESMDFRIWTFACLYDGKDVNQQTACYFMEKVVMLSEFFRKSSEWRNGGKMAGQEQFGPILTAQMEQFKQTANLAVDETLEFSKQIVASNVEMLSSQAF